VKNIQLARLRRKEVTPAQLFANNGHPVSKQVQKIGETEPRLQHLFLENQSLISLDLLAIQFIYIYRKHVVHTIFP